MSFIDIHRLGLKINNQTTLVKLKKKWCLSFETKQVVIDMSFFTKLDSKLDC
jgi:hypothetical protein